MLIYLISGSPKIVYFYNSFASAHRFISRFCYYFVAVYLKYMFAENKCDSQQST